MTKYPMKKTGILMLAAVLMTAFGWAQNPPPSPPATASGKIGAATITINYSSPGVKGRKIFGGLQPYGKAWRAGANPATILEVDKDVMIEGKKLPAGKYTLFMTPGEKEWELIINSETGQWGIKRTGEANFDPANNVLTATVKPLESPFTERLVYEITDKGFALRWENTLVPISVK